MAYISKNRVCKICGKIYEGPISSKYCSDYCKNESRFTEGNLCVICGSRAPNGNKTCLSKECKCEYNKRYTNFKRVEVIEKGRQTKLDRYGDANYNNIDKCLNTQIEKYGGWYLKTSDCRSKTKETSLKKYGVSHPMQCSEVSKKCHTPEIEAKRSATWRQTLISLYGGCGNAAEELKEKQHQSMIEKYGAPTAAQAGLVKKSYYKYDDIYFDSFLELALFIYAIDHNEEIIRLPIRFEYIFEDKIHYYFPDFLYNGKLIEIKGGHLISDDGSWQNPYDHSQDELYEAKHQCALANNVEIWSDSDCTKFKEYFHSKYKREDFLVIDE